MENLKRVKTIKNRLGIPSDMNPLFDAVTDFPDIFFKSKVTDVCAMYSFDRMEASLYFIGYSWHFGYGSQETQLFIYKEWKN